MVCPHWYSAPSSMTWHSTMRNSSHARTSWCTAAICAMGRICTPLDPLAERFQAELLYNAALTWQYSRKTREYLKAILSHTPLLPWIQNHDCSPPQYNCAGFFPGTLRSVLLAAPGGPGGPRTQSRTAGG